MKSLSFTLVIMVGAFGCGYCLQQGMRTIHRTAEPAVVPPTSPALLPALVDAQPPTIVPIQLTSAQREAASNVVFSGDEVSLRVLRAHFEEKAGLDRKPAIAEVEFDVRIDPAKPGVLRIDVRLMTANGIIPVEADGKLSIRVQAEAGDEPQMFSLGAGLLADYLVKEPGVCEYRLGVRPKGPFGDGAIVRVTYADNRGGEVGGKRRPR